MAKIEVRKTTIKHKDNKPRPKITLKRTVINGQVAKLNKDAAAKRGR